MDSIHVSDSNFISCLDWRNRLRCLTVNRYQGLDEKLSGPPRYYSVVHGRLTQGSYFVLQLIPILFYKRSAFNTLESEPNGGYFTSLGLDILINSKPLLSWFYFLLYPIHLQTGMTSIPQYYLKSKKWVWWRFGNCEPLIYVWKIKSLNRIYSTGLLIGNVLNTMPARCTSESTWSLLYQQS